ncbi:MAG TPA: hypothetical protein VFN35_17625, partial [Ktedonobacteraceae bacterium]|nr:hypothetical protein [Ktedonobacteraceae bacterium]
MSKALSSQEALFSGGGEMGALMRAFDWAKTSIGPVEQWSPSLRTAVGILLHSRYPMFLWWGPDLIQLYNDAYRPSLGSDRHPSALGRPGREDWGEIWPIIGPMVESVLGGGEATWSEDQLIPITRQGFLEEVYWTFSYSPVLEDDGTVGGVLVVCSESTRQVRAERRLRTLAGLTSEVIDAKTAEEIVTITARVLTENPADLPFALLYTLSPESNQLRLATTVGLAPGTAASPLLVDLSNASLPVPDRWDLQSVLKTRTSVLIEDASARFGNLPGGIWDVPSTSALVLPLLMAGHPHPFGVLVVGISPG